MEGQLPRGPVTIDTAQSGNVTESAIRLFTGGFLARVQRRHHEDGRVTYTMPSESRAGVFYTIEYAPADRTVQCSCLAGQHKVPCKHVRLLQFQQGWVVEEWR